MNHSPLLAGLLALLALGACTGGEPSQGDQPSDTDPPPELAIETTVPPMITDEPLTVPGPLTEDAVGGLITTYLPGHILQAEFGGEVFCAYEMYGWEQTSSDATAWLWVHCEEYYLTDGELRTGSGLSSPISVHAAESDSGWTMVGHDEPELGDLYLDSVREMFPPTYADRALEGRPSRDLSADAEHAARSKLAS